MAGGFFDGKTGADERRQYLLDLFKHSAQQEATGAAAHILTNTEVKPYLASSSLSALAASGPYGYIYIHIH